MGSLDEAHSSKRVLSLDYAISGQITQPSTACVHFTDTQFWRKGARKKSRWLTEVRQNGDTDHYQLLKVTKRRIQNLCIVASQEEPRRHEENFRPGVTSLLCNCHGCWTQHCLDRGVTVADGQPGHHCLGAPWLSGLHGSTYSWCSGAWGHPQSANKS